MGGLGSHALHPYAIQTIAFSLSLLIPGGVFVLLGAAWFENHQRTSGHKAAEALASWRGADERSRTPSSPKAVPPTQDAAAAGSPR